MAISPLTQSQGLGAIQVGGASNRGRTGTPLFRKAADFKSAVSTNFTIRACGAQLTRVPRLIVKQNSLAKPAWRQAGEAVDLEARPRVELG
jgi:hypothetical protein